MLDLVVARYNEDVSWLESFPADRIFLYNKGADIPELPSNARYCQLPNWGRESDTYLTHIIAHYHDFADHTVFLQGNPFDHCSDPVQKLKYLPKSFLPLGQVWELRPEYFTDWDRQNWFHLAAELSKLVWGEYCLPMGVSTVQGAQFAVSKEAIRIHTLNLYHNIKRISDRESSFPWGIERYWMSLFTLGQFQFDNCEKIRFGFL